MWKGEAVTLLAVGPEQCAIRGEEGARIVVDTEGLVKVEKVKADWIVVSYYGKNQFAATEAEARELCTQLLALGLGPEGNAIADFARRMLRREDAAEIAQAMRLLRAFEDMEAPEELGTLDLLAYLRASCARETGSHVFSEESEEI